MSPVSKAARGRDSMDIDPPFGVCELARRAGAGFYSSPAPGGVLLRFASFPYH
jgi:hypothetical protein